MKQQPPIRVGVAGASGYVGCELIRWLARHPAVEIAFATSEHYAGRRLSDLYPTAPDVPLGPAAEAPWETVQVAFTCLPHGAAAETVGTALAAGCRVVDLSADFRLRDAAAYAAWYGAAHPAPELLGEAVYGLTEWNREAVSGARLVANPGCYPTSVLLALAPLLALGERLRGPVVVDAKSGVSGAGRTPTDTTHFVQVADNLSPYKVGRVHRHLPEMEQELARLGAGAPSLVFCPHLLPVPRGMLSTLYVSFEGPLDLAAVRVCYADAYAQEPFVRLLPDGQYATLAHAVQTNRCVLSLAAAGDTLVVHSAIDNLVKGAAGQAVQNMNRMFGLPETLGLD